MKGLIELDLIAAAKEQKEKIIDISKLQKTFTYLDHSQIEEILRKHEFTKFRTKREG